jgi:hypothetical protein
MLLLTLRGTPTCYYGDEIGMVEDGEIPPELVRDPQRIKSPGYGRDPARTPMQWDASPNAGFCPKSAEPWLPVAGDYEMVSVEAQRGNPRSMLSLFRRLIGLRRKLPALTVGSYRPFDTGDGSVRAFLREHEEQRVLVVLTFGTERRVLDLSHLANLAHLTVLLGNVFTAGLPSLSQCEPHHPRLDLSDDQAAASIVRVREFVAPPVEHRAVRLRGLNVADHVAGHHASHERSRKPQAQDPHQRHVDPVEPLYLGPAHYAVRDPCPEQSQPAGG